MENEEKKDKVFELVLGDDEMNDGVSTISFVEHPAHESNFMYFSAEEKVEFKFAEEGEKKIVTGAALIPNQKIFRLDAEENEYHVFFKEETVAKCQELFFKRAQHKSSNVEHMFAVDGVTVVESWLVTDPANDKSNALGFSGIPKGTWFVSYKIDNDELWEGIKSGDVKGFSIEGKFIDELVKASEQNIEQNLEKEEEVVEKVEEKDQQTLIQEVITGDLSDDEMYDLIKDILNNEK